MIWIGNSYAGDLALYDPAQVLNYIGQGGNFLLASRQGADFFSTELLNYCGITSMTGLMDVTELIALDNNLTNMPVTSAHSRVRDCPRPPRGVSIPTPDGQQRRRSGAH